MFCRRCHKTIEAGHYIGRLANEDFYLCDECKMKKDSEPRVRGINLQYHGTEPHPMIQCGKRGIEYTCKKLEETGALQNKPDLKRYCDIKMAAAKKMEYSNIDLQKVGYDPRRSKAPN